MKKYTFLFCLFLQIALAFAQAPEKMSYQAVVRNNNNVLVSNHAVGMRISILQGSATGTAVYTETQIPTTNANGLIAIEIGTGTVVTGTFSNIDWANGPYFVKTETDPNGGTAYTLTASNQLLSVPYALYAKKSSKVDTAIYALNGLPLGGIHGQYLTNCNGFPIWTTSGQCPPKVDAIICGDTIHHGEIYVNSPASKSSWAYTEIGFTGGSGFLQETKILSKGVEGLIATAIGSLETNYKKLVFNITGIPNSTGIASFTFEIDGKSCTFHRVVINPYQLNTVNCTNNSTAIVDVTNPATGKIWMDRNLGASRAATSSTDSLAYGDLFQWGRRADGHQCRNSSTTTTLSSTDQPTHANFILAPNSPYDWRTPQNDNLWQGVNGVNNPCPKGYRLPTSTELQLEFNDWSLNNDIGAFDSQLKLPKSGYRYSINGLQYTTGNRGYYWSSSVSGSGAWYLHFSSSGSTSNILNYDRAYGFSVRCIKD